jgi:hypothetical protein
VLVGATTAHGLRRLAEAYGQAMGWLLAADSAARADAYRRGRAQLDVVTSVAAQHVRSIGDVGPGEAGARLVVRGVAQVEAEGRQRLADLDALWRDVAGARAPLPGPALSAVEQRLAALRPVLTGTPRDFEARRVNNTPGLHNLMTFEVTAAVDGRRTGLDIYRLVAAEARAAGAQYYGVVAPEAVEAHLRALAGADLIRMQ